MKSNFVIENYIKDNIEFIYDEIQFCDKNENPEKLESNGLLPEIIKILAKRNEKYIKDKMNS